MILDVDGTLVDSNDAHTQAWVEAFRSEGIAVAYDGVRRSIGMGGDKLMPAVSGIAEDSELGERISKRRAEIFRERYLPRLRPFAGTRPLVQRFIDDGLAVAIASSAKEDELQPLLEIAGIADLVGHRTSSDDAERSKPDPDIVHAAVGRVKSDPRATVMIGDTPYDVDAALRAGIRIVGVESGGWTPADLKGATAVYKTAADLLNHYDASVFPQLRST